MYEDLQDLYQALILDHYRKPRNRGPLEGATRSIELKNPLCGDVIAVDLRLDAGKVADIRFHGHGCSISQSSASMMTELLKGKSEAEARELCGLFKGMMRNEGDLDALGPRLGDLVSLSGVPRKFAQRVKCATLAWHAVEAALAGGAGHVDTDGEGNVPGGAGATPAPPGAGGSGPATTPGPGPGPGEVRPSAPLIPGGFENAIAECRARFLEPTDASIEILPFPLLGRVDFIVPIHAEYSSEGRSSCACCFYNQYRKGRVVLPTGPDPAISERYRRDLSPDGRPPHVSLGATGHSDPCSWRGRDEPHVVSDFVEYDVILLLAVEDRCRKAFSALRIVRLWWDDTERRFRSTVELSPTAPSRDEFLQGEYPF